MSDSKKRFVLYGTLLLSPAAVLGGYFLWLVYQPFAGRTIAPETLSLEYDGPGSLKRERASPTNPAP